LEENNMNDVKTSMPRRALQVDEPGEDVRSQSPPLSYEPPRLTRVGNLCDLLAGATGNNGDGSGGLKRIG
jgi:hypothetical protein